MVRKVNEKKFKKGVLEFPCSFVMYNEKNSMATVSCPFPRVRELSWNKETLLVVTVREAKEGEFPELEKNE